MRRCLWPRSEFVDANSRFYRHSSVGTINGDNIICDQPALDRRAEAELCHIIHEALYPVLHYATSPFWRIDTNRASFSMLTMSSSS